MWCEKTNYDGELSPSTKVPSLQSPSVLLQISLSNPDLLDEIEEEAYSTLDHDRDTVADTIISEEMIQSLSSVDHKISRPRMGTDERDQLTKEEQKAAEEERKNERKKMMAQSLGFM